MNEANNFRTKLKYHRYLQIERHGIFLFTPIHYLIPNVETLLNPILKPQISPRIFEPQLRRVILHFTRYGTNPNHREI